MPYGDAMDFMPSPQIGSAGGGAIDGGVEARNGPYSGSRGEEKPPGSAWNNKKAHDDCRRAMDGLLDDKFSLRKSFWLALWEWLIAGSDKVDSR